MRITGQPDREILEFEINGDEPDFQIATERIASWGLADVKPRFLDLLDVAGAVFAADGMVRRGGADRPRLGASWGRRLHFEIDVRDTKFWRSRKVTDALVDLVRFLTEDDVSFTFRTAAATPPPQRYLQFEGDDQKSRLQADHVILFSGGLDSLAGALETLSQEDGRVVLVTHRSAQKNTRHQDELAKALQTANPDRVSYVPIVATRRGARAPETTQRSRSLLFAAFGFVIARISGTSRLSFFENGVVSQNLPLSPQIIGTMATRTTHPLTLRKFAEFLTLVDEAAFDVRNPFQWMTKKEIVEKIRDHGCGNLIERTVSCNHVWRRTRERTHCGACSQCLDRRFGILAAGLEENDPENRYMTPILLGEREDDRSRIEAVEWTRHALRLERLDISAFQDRFGGDVARISRRHAGVSDKEVLRRTHALQCRHGASVKAVIEAAIASKSGAIVGQTLPGGCLLSLVLGDLVNSTGIPEVDAESVLKLDAGEKEQELDETVLILRRKDDHLSFAVHGLGMVSGAPAGPAFALHPQYMSDKSAGLEKDEHRYVKPGAMIPMGGASAGSVTQNVKRCRQELASFYEEIFGEPPPEHLILQSRKGRGYRIDPHVVVIGPDD